MSEQHIQTDKCGFDRNSSHSEDRYVCGCGWRGGKLNYMGKGKLIADQVLYSFYSKERPKGDEGKE